MTRITKNELVTINARIATENATLRARVAQLEEQLASERALHQQQITNVTEVASAVNKMPAPRDRIRVVPARQLSEAEVAYREAAGRARALAIATGRTVALAR